VLPSGGVLAIVEYVRDESGSATARAVVEFLRQHGGPRAYSRPDYPGELGRLAGFGNIDAIQQPVTLLLGLPAFAGLVLSSSYARETIEQFGRARAEAMIQTIGAALVGDDGKVPFGYLFHAWLVTRI